MAPCNSCAFLYRSLFVNNSVKLYLSDKQIWIVIWIWRTNYLCGNSWNWDLILKTFIESLFKIHQFVAETLL